VGGIESERVKIGSRTLNSIFKLFDQKNAKKIDTFSKIVTHDLIIFGAKKVFLHFLKVGSELFRSCLDIIFDLKNPNYSRLLSSKGRYMTSKIKLYVQFWLMERTILTIIRLKRSL